MKKKPFEYTQEEIDAAVQAAVDAAIEKVIEELITMEYLVVLEARVVELA